MGTSFIGSFLFVTLQDYFYSEHNIFWPKTVLFSAIMSVFGDMCSEGEECLPCVSGVANVEIVTGAGASLVTLCPNELYAKQIPPILRSHGERPGEAVSAGQKHGDIYINTEYSGLRNKKSIFHPAQSSGESLRTSSAGAGGDE